MNKINMKSKSLTRVIAVAISLAFCSNCYVAYSYDVTEGENGGIRIGEKSLAEENAKNDVNAASAASSSQKVSQQDIEKRRFEIMAKIDEFIEKANVLFEEQNTQELFALCQEKIKELQKIPEFSDEERMYAATIYSTLAQILTPKEALRCLDAAINFMPSSADLYWQRADIKIELNDYIGAEEDYNTVIENAPCEEAFKRRGNLYLLHIKNLKAAIKDYTKAIEFNPNSRSYFQRGMAKHDMDDFMGALEDYTKTIKLYPDFLPAYKYRADARVSIGWVDGAIEDFKKILEFEPEDEVARRALSDMAKIKNEGGTVIKCTLKTGEKAVLYQSCIGK